jgi:hypothetical protein
MSLRILVSGMIAGIPRQGGATWAVLQYVLGLQELGHTVYLVEPLAPDALRPAGTSLPTSTNTAYFGAVMAEFGLSRTAALVLVGSQQTVGIGYQELRRACRRADVLINIGGMLTDEALVGTIPIRVYLDLDPAFTQLWYTAQGIDMRFEGHTHFVTIGQAIGRPHCPVPTCGRHWLTTAQPVVLSHWPVAGQITYDALTTVANWRGYGSIEHAGITYGQKVHSLRRFMMLPTRSTEQFVMALAIHPEEQKDLQALAANGWRLVDPSQVADSPAAYRQFVSGSKAEFGIAKSGYVAAQCGWFSDRSLCYLAAGRPVIAQDTGFSPFLPTGAGLFAFNTAEDVLAAIEAINADYARHACAARAIVEEYSDAARVLTRLLQQIDAR